MKCLIIHIELKDSILFRFNPFIWYNKIIGMNINLFVEFVHVENLNTFSSEIQIAQS